jgi:hypothetical protein
MEGEMGWTYSMYRSDNKFLPTDFVCKYEGRCYLGNIDLHVRVYEGRVQNNRVRGYEAE